MIHVGRMECTCACMHFSHGYSHRLSKGFITQKRQKMIRLETYKMTVSSDLNISDFLNITYVLGLSREIEQ